MTNGLGIRKKRKIESGIETLHSWKFNVKNHKKIIWDFYAWLVDCDHKNTNRETDRETLRAVVLYFAHNIFSYLPFHFNSKVRSKVRAPNQSLVTMPSC